MRKLNTRFIGVVYVDNELFTHYDTLMGVADCTRNKVLHQLRVNVRDSLSRHFIENHIIEFRVFNPFTHKVEYIKY